MILCITIRWRSLKENFVQANTKIEKGTEYGYLFLLIGEP
jgi:hypothetical protein